MNATPTVAEIMTVAPVAIRAAERVGRAAREMELGRFRHLPVVDGDQRVVGIVSQRDLLTARDGRVPVREVMSADVETVAPGTAAHEAAFLLLRHAIGCVPVVDDGGRLVGIVTERDFVRIAYAALGGAVPADDLIEAELEADRT